MNNTTQDPIKQLRRSNTNRTLSDDIEAARELKKRIKNMDDRTEADSEAIQGIDVAIGDLKRAAAHTKKTHEKHKENAQKRLRQIASVYKNEVSH